MRQLTRFGIAVLVANVDGRVTRIAWVDDCRTRVSVGVGAAGGRGDLWASATADVLIVVHVKGRTVGRGGDAVLAGAPGP